MTPETSRFITERRKIASGGGGLTGTARDYMRFCQMMLNERLRSTANACSAARPSNS